MNIVYIKCWCRIEQLSVELRMERGWTKSGCVASPRLDELRMGGKTKKGVVTYVSLLAVLLALERLGGLPLDGAHHVLREALKEIGRPIENI